MVSETYEVILDDKGNPVLILVLLEDGIGEIKIQVYDYIHSVLILVLLEDGIGVVLR